MKMRHFLGFSCIAWQFISPAQALPVGNYNCTQSQVFQFNDTGEKFGVAAVLSTDLEFSLLDPQEGSTLVYQSGGTTYLIDEIEADWAKFKFRVVYSGDLRTFSGYCQPM